MENQKVKDLVVGKWYYTYDSDNSLKMVRIRKIYNSQKIAVESKDTDGKYVTSMLTHEDLKNYRGLKSDYVITVSVEIGSIPVIVCRQFVSTELGELTNDGKIHLGACVSVDSFDKSTINKYAAFMAMDGIVEYSVINGYINDVPEDILKFINIKTELKSSEVLKSIYDKYSDKFSGLSKSVADLLKQNNFWREVDRMLNIVDVNFEIRHNTIEEEQLVVLENYIHHAMLNVDVVEYRKDINPDDIKTDFLLVRDISSKVYLVNYVQGKFILDPNAMSEEEFKKFTNMGKK